MTFLDKVNNIQAFILKSKGFLAKTIFHEIGFNVEWGYMKLTPPVEPDRVQFLRIMHCSLLSWKILYRR